MKERLPLALSLLISAGIPVGILSASAGGLQPLGAEFPITRSLPGDQVNPSVACDGSGGIVVWQDAAIDGQGLGIAGLRLRADGKPVNNSPFRVNADGNGDQENPSIICLGNGATFVVWQGGRAGFQQIRGRVLGADSQPITGDLEISQGDGEHKLNPAITRLSDGNVAVVWASYRQEFSLGYDVFGRVFTTAGEPVSDEFRVNATLGLGRRNPVICPLSHGGFLVGWIAERQIGIRDHLDSTGLPLTGTGSAEFAVSLVVRAFSSEGEAIGQEQTLSGADGIAATPALEALEDGRVMAAWTRKRRTGPGELLDIAGRIVGPSGVPLTAETLLNATLPGNQLRPRLSSGRHGILAIWTSVGQDGSAEGVFGRWIDGDGVPSGDDILINTQRGGGQILPAVTKGGSGELWVTWSSNLPRTGHEIFAQRLIPLLLTVKAGGSGLLHLEWPTIPGESYQLKSSTNGRQWADVGVPRVATSTTDSVDLPVSGQIVLYRVVRVQ